MNPVVAAAVVLLFPAVAATSAFAEFQYADLTNNDSLGGNATYGGTQNNGSGAPDGSLLTLTSPGGAGTARVRIRFANNVDAPGLILYSVTVSGSVTITQFRWSDNGDLAATTNEILGTDIIPAGAITPGSYSTYSVNSGSFTPAFTPDFHRFAFITFSLTSGSSISFDAVSNPEPGTFALFGLGAAGLGAFVWKRRRRVAVASATA